jgi:hypothetical protein
VSSEKRLHAASLRLAHVEVGLVLNFHAVTLRDGIKRLVL